MTGSRNHARPHAHCRRSILQALAAASAMPFVGRVHRANAEELTLRVGHFPNLTHVQALVARAFERHGRSWFGERLGDGCRLQWFTYNAGPSAMEAIFAKTIDLSYVGPIRPSTPMRVRRAARYASSRAPSRVAQRSWCKAISTLAKPADFRGKRIATPQFGNTQDVAARAWLAAGGLRITQAGGDAQVLPTENPDQLSLFKSGQLDAVWTVEPWVSRLEMEAGGKVLVEEKNAITTNLRRAPPSCGSARVGPPSGCGASRAHRLD